MTAVSSHGASTPRGVWRPPRLATIVADELRRRILSGELKPGAALRQEELAEDLQVSRTPLREALLQLTNEGLITHSTSNVSYVVSLDWKRAEELMDVRGVIDGLATRFLAIRGLTPETRQLLEAHTERMAEAAARGAKSDFLLANCDFHSLIIEATGHSELQRQIPLIQRSAYAVYLMENPQWPVPRAHQTIAEHQAIIDAIARGAADEAEALAKQHILNASAFWVSTLKTSDAAGGMPE